MRALEEYLSKLGQATVALSGGVDSTLLAYYCHKILGDKASAITAVSEFTSQHELKNAKYVAELIGIKHKIITLSVLKTVKNNPLDRCYHCKKFIFSSISGPNVCDGTNTDDKERPGLKAIKELGVLSPLAACGIGKQIIIRKTQELSLPLTPSNSCLATRLPHNSIITQELLDLVEQTESKLRCAGIINFRARPSNDKLTIETDESEHTISKISKQLGFSEVEYVKRNFEYA